MKSIIVYPTIKHTHTFICLHGMCCYAEDMKDNFQKLIEHYPSIKFIFINSPTMTVNWPDGKQHNVKSWYNYYTCNDGLLKHDIIDINGLNDQKNRIIKVLNRETNLLGDNKKIFLCGSSQGGTVCLHSLMHLNYPIGGVFCLRTVFMDNISKVNPNNKETPIFIFAGQNDEIYKLLLQRRSFSKLANSGFILYWHVQPKLDHSTYSKKEVNTINKWLKTTF